MDDETKKIAQPSKNGQVKRLVEQLTEAALASDGEGKKPTKKNKALFLSKKDEIKEAMDAGWRMKNIWALLAEQQVFVGGYDCFIRYVHRYITNSVDAPQAPPSSHEPPPPVSHTSRREYLSAASNFDFSPTFTPQELYGDEEKNSTISAKNGVTDQKPQ